MWRIIGLMALAGCAQPMAEAELVDVEVGIDLARLDEPVRFEALLHVNRTQDFSKGGYWFQLFTLMPLEDGKPGSGFTVINERGNDRVFVGREAERSVRIFGDPAPTGRYLLETAGFECGQPLDADMSVLNGKWGTIAFGDTTLECL